MSTQYKICIKCDQSLPQTTEFFNRDSQKSDGFCPYCKNCRHAKRANEYENSPNFRQKNRERAAKWFNENLERARQTRKKHYQYNRDKAIQRAKEWREHNPDRKKELDEQYYKKYYPEHKDDYVSRTRNRRAKLQKSTGKHTSKDIQEILEYQNGLCFYCRKELRNFEVDHYYPVSKGGSNSKENLVISCQHCNRSKGSKSPQDFYIK